MRCTPSVLPLLLLFAAAALSAPLPDAVKEANERDKKALQGNWQVVDLESGGGHPIKPAQLRKLKHAFRGNEFILDGTDEDKSDMPIHYKVDATKDPKTIDFAFEGKDATSWLGIYKIDGDKLVICWGNDGGARPTKFQTSQDDGGWRLYTMTRVARDKKKDGK
jgi:uncharacterized protein (TIGR03067 family)